MEGIPPARATDKEEVRWALETAESLWKRSALVDAIVWLRRAAQEAAQGGDAERAAGLMAEATTLTETMARASAHARSSLPASVPPGVSEGDIDELLAADSTEMAEEGVEELDSADLVSELPPTPKPTRPAPRMELPGERSSEVPTPARAPWENDDPLERSSEVPTPLREVEMHGAAVDSTSGVATPVVHVGHAAREAAVPSERVGITHMGDGALSAMDLAGVAELAGLSDEAREHLVRDARVILCTSDIVLPEFAFGLILEGEVAARSEGGFLVGQYGHGKTLRTRGTLKAPFPAAFTATLDGTTMALWSEAGLARALETNPAIDDALRSAGDGLQAWAYVAASPLGARLHEDVRMRLVTRLTARALLPGAELVAAKDAVPGLLLVGVGKITVDEPVASVLGPGRFVFAGETLSAGRATATARAGDDGAVVLCADRATTQELCVTEPLLLELLALDC